MLVISRKNGQKIMLNDNIVITVVDVSNGQCKIAIEADKSVKIYREELYYKIKLANLIGQNTTAKEAESVSAMVNNSDILINKNITKSQDSDEKICDDQNHRKRIIINKKDNTDNP